jgi:hypothetical protein
MSPPAEAHDAKHVGFDPCPSPKLPAKPYECIGFGAMDVTKPYEFMRLWAMDVTKPYEFISLGAMDVTKPFECNGFGAMCT